MKHFKHLKFTDWLISVVFFLLLIEVVYVSFSGATSYSNQVFSHALFSYLPYGLGCIWLKKDMSKIEITYVVVAFFWTTTPAAFDGSFLFGFDAIMFMPIIWLATMFVLIPVRDAITKVNKSVTAQQNAVVVQKINPLPVGFKPTTWEDILKLEAEKNSQLAFAS